MKVFAGDNFKPAADASYRNLLWENFHVDHSFDFGAKIVADKEIGTIDSWGPFFSVSLDLIIHSLPKYGWAPVLAFIYEIGRTGEPLPAPAIYLHRSGFLQFRNIFGLQDNKSNFKFELHHWYNIIIEQKSSNGKVTRL